MDEREPLRARWFKATVAIFFLVSGGFATFVLLFSAPSLWYIACAVLWTISGFIWFFLPSFAVGFSAIPVLGIAIMFVVIRSYFREMDSIYRILLLCVVIAMVLIAISFRWPETHRLKPIAFSLILVLMAFSVDRLFTGKVSVVSFAMNWTANGVAPWGAVERDEKGAVPVVIYRKVDGGYCYDAVFSPELKARLNGPNKVINVEYNVFSDFGRRRGYNIRSIDGLIFNEGERPVRTGETYGGYVMGSDAANCGR